MHLQKKKEHKLTAWLRHFLFLLYLCTFWTLPSELISLQAINCNDILLMVIFNLGMMWKMSDLEVQKYFLCCVRVV